MNGKYYIGKNVSDFEKYKEVGPITGISLLVDDDMEYRAGDDSGFVLEVPCTHGTPQMADNILASLKGKTYKGFHADGAVLDPRAELGDGLTVNNTYSMLAYRKVSFGPGHMSEISAPGDEEVEHEYPYVSGTKREINRKLATVRSSITKKADEILLEVSQQYSTKEETKTTIEQTVKGITLSAKAVENSSHLTLSSNGIEISSADITIDGVVTFTDLSTPGKTVIDGGNITTGSLSADRIQGGTLTLGGQNNIDGSMTIKNASGTSIGTINNDGINFSSGNIKLGSRFNAVNNGNLYFRIPYISGSIYMQTVTGSMLNPDSYIQVFSLLTDSQIWTYPDAIFSKGVTVFGKLVNSGSKSRLVSTPDYSDRLLYCYEMPSPMFGDIGEGETDENGECYIYLDDVFTETVSTDIEYQVFLQEEGEGDLIVTEKNRYYFVVNGTPGMKFSWEVKAKQRDYEYDRMELYDRYPERENKPFDYERQYETEIEELLKEKEMAVYEAA